MIRKTNTYIGLDKYDVLIEDVNLEYFKIYELSSILPLGKSSFLIDIAENKFVKNSELKIEIVDADGEVVYTEIPLYREGLLRRISMWVYPENSNGTATLTILGELKDVSREWSGIYNIRYKTTIAINKNLENSQPIRFYNTPSVTITEDRKSYLLREFPDSTATQSFSGSLIDCQTDRYGNYFIYLKDRTFDEYMINPTIELALPNEGTKSFDLKYITNDKVATIDQAYSSGSDLGNSSDISYIISYETQPTTSNSENFQSFAEAKITDMNLFSGEIKKIKTYLKSRGAYGYSDYILVNDSVLQPKELLIDSEWTGSV